MSRVQIEDGDHHTIAKNTNSPRNKSDNDSHTQPAPRSSNTFMDSPSVEDSIHGNTTNGDIVQSIQSPKPSNDISDNAKHTKSLAEIMRSILDAPSLKLSSALALGSITMETSSAGISNKEIGSFQEFLRQHDISRHAVLLEWFTEQQASTAIGIIQSTDDTTPDSDKQMVIYTPEQAAPQDMEIGSGDKIYSVLNQWKSGRDIPGKKKSQDKFHSLDFVGFSDHEFSEESKDEWDRSQVAHHVDYVADFRHANARIGELCANCKLLGHRLNQCIGPVGPNGKIKGCPMCNKVNHTLEQCHSLRKCKRHRAVLRKWLCTLRDNKPELESSLTRSQLLNLARSSEHQDERVCAPLLPEYAIAMNKLYPEHQSLFMYHQNYLEDVPINFYGWLKIHEKVGLNWLTSRVVYKTQQESTRSIEGAQNSGQKRARDINNEETGSAKKPKLLDGL